MLKSFDKLVVEKLRARRGELDGTLEQDFLKHPELYRKRIFKRLSEELQIAYNEDVIVLIDEYDSPMHVAIENNYANSVWHFILSPVEWDSPDSRPAGSLRRSLAHFSRFVGSLVHERVVLSSMDLQSNPAVCACMMVGICRTTRSSWFSDLDYIEVCDLASLCCLINSEPLRSFQCTPKMTDTQHPFCLPRRKLNFCTVHMKAKCVIPSTDFR